VLSESVASCKATFCHFMTTEIHDVWFCYLRETCCWIVWLNESIWLLHNYNDSIIPPITYSHFANCNRDCVTLKLFD
jgi:hypothetical protein